MLIMIHNGRIVFQEEKDFLLDNYRIIKGDKKLLTENIRQLFLNITETAFGFAAVFHIIIQNIQELASA